MRQPKYHFEVHWDKKQSLNVAQCVELPRCKGLGLTKEAAITDAKNAIRAFLRSEKAMTGINKERPKV